MDQYSFHYNSVVYDLWTTDFGVCKKRSEIVEGLERWIEWCDYLIIDTSTSETNTYLKLIGRGDLVGQEYVIISATDVLG